MVLGQAANGDYLCMSFRSSIKQWYFEFTHQNRLKSTVFVFLS